MEGHHWREKSHHTELLIPEKTWDASNSINCLTPRVVLKSLNTLSITLSTHSTIWALDLSLSQTLHLILVYQDRCHLIYLSSKSQTSQLMKLLRVWPSLIAKTGHRMHCGNILQVPGWKCLPWWTSFSSLDYGQVSCLYLHTAALVVLSTPNVATASPASLAAIRHSPICLKSGWQCPWHTEQLFF